jgi:hypothetical protein
MEIAFSRVWKRGGEHLQSQDQFYCITCHALKGRNDATDVFKTGFYKVHYPLGFCTFCEEVTDLKQVANGRKNEPPIASGMLREGL